jgi:hypothetical protein
VTGAGVRLMHDWPVRARWGTAALAGCVVALSGCSVLSGRTSSDGDSTSSIHPSGSSSTSELAAGYTNAGAVSEVLRAARHGFETVYTFDYRNLAKYYHAGARVTTNPYAATYRDGLHGQSATNLRGAKVVEIATARVTALADLSEDGTRATAIVHGALTTSASGSTNANTRTITVGLGMELHGHDWLIATLANGAARTGRIPANADLRAAMSRARVTITRIYGLHRTHFTRDFNDVVEATVGVLQSTLLNQQSALRQTLEDGQYDLSSRIVGFSVLKADGADAEFIVTINEYRLSRRGTRLGPYPHTLDVTATGVDGKWLLSSATPLT